MGFQLLEQVRLMTEDHPFGKKALAMPGDCRKIAK
jgi:hypothetical protein